MSLNYLRLSKIYSDVLDRSVFKFSMDDAVLQFSIFYSILVLKFMFVHIWLVLPAGCPFSVYIHHISLIHSHNGRHWVATKKLQPIALDMPMLMASCHSSFASNVQE